MIKKLLKKLGLNGQEMKIYLALLNSGSSSIRQIASKTGINRGTVYESLKKLIKNKLITHQIKKRQKHFAVENPETIKALLRSEREKLTELENEISASLPRLKAFYSRVNQESYIKIYEGASGTKFILEDLLKTLKNKKNREYFAITSADIGKCLYKNFPDFNERRISAGIKAKTIATGKGAKPEGINGINGMNGVKWLGETLNEPACVFIYANKIALVSADKEGSPTSVLIENPALAAVQKTAFEKLWEMIK
ncbi:MAG: helix-turn-helix domain-containing protein [Patescibacteria group bacterium]